MKNIIESTMKRPRKGHAIVFSLVFSVQIPLCIIPSTKHESITGVDIMYLHGFNGIQQNAFQSKFYLMKAHQVTFTKSADSY